MTSCLNLKRFLTSVVMGLVGMAFFSALCSCEKEDDFVLSVSPSEMSQGIEHKGGTYSLLILSSDVWTVEVAAEAASWLHVSPTEGAAGECIVQLTVDGHEGEQPRVGTLTFRSGELSRTVTVTQQEWVLLPDSDGVDEMPVEPW
ncbi:BACON domain-containing protein [Phocaeicola barnesiae]|uniref:BACON domain-containing protein n=1 Tax=Phocaeicola barnesiae TaxID=376804 RepID=UPI000376A196|nr:BACON domain-containing protein [Phocaeicola barnesiae]